MLTDYFFFFFSFFFFRLATYSVCVPRLPPEMSHPRHDLRSSSMNSHSQTQIPQNATYHTPIDQQSAQSPQSLSPESISSVGKNRTLIMFESHRHRDILQIIADHSLMNASIKIIYRSLNVLFDEFSLYVFSSNEFSIAKENFHRTNSTTSCF